jgi:hypothetical protein
MAWLVGALTVSAGVAVALSLGRGQEQAGPTPAPRAPAPGPAVPLEKLTPLHKEMYLSAQAGAEWLQRAHSGEGLFAYGFVPDLNVRLEGDHYLRQAGAAFALARAARFLKSDRYAVKARQAVVTLLMDTAEDPKQPGVRTTTLPSLLLNRLATAGLLVQAINELPDPADDLLRQSEQLCTYIRRQQQADGSFALGDTTQEIQALRKADPDAANYYPGEALYGLMLSQRHRPAAWKTEAVRKARGYYLPAWRAHKSVSFVPWHTAAYTEAFLLTKDTAFADAVAEMNNWLCELQYLQLDRRHPLWFGGFMSWADGKPVPAAPDAGCGSAVGSLAEACRVARQRGDLSRHRRYQEGLEHGLRFLATLQYTQANTQHFADWYRTVLLGGFHASHQDGTLRIDYTQHAVCALVQYLRYEAQVGGGE